MSFGQPLALIALAAVPALVALWRFQERRRATQATAFSSPALVPNLVSRRPGRRRTIALGILLVALVALDRRDCSSTRQRQRPAQGGDGRARDRRLALDAGAGRPTDATRRCAKRGAGVPQGGAEGIQHRGRRVRHECVRGAAADHRPGACTRRAQLARSERGNGDRRRSRALDEARDATADDRRHHAADIGARHLGRRTRRWPDCAARGSTQGSRRARPGVDRARRHAERLRHEQARRRLRRADSRPTEPGHAAADRAAERRAVLPRPDERRADVGLQEARGADRPPHASTGRSPISSRAAASSSCSSAAGSRRSGSGGRFREAAAHPLGARGDLRRCGCCARLRDERVPRPPGVRAGGGAVGPRLARRGAVSARLPQALRGRRSRRGALEPRHRRRLRRQPRQPREPGHHDVEGGGLPRAPRARQRLGRELSAAHRLRAGLGQAASGPRRPITRSRPASRASGT